MVLKPLGDRFENQGSITYQRSMAALSAEEVMSFSALVSGKEDISA